MSPTLAHWLPVALSRDIEPSSSAGLDVDGCELVVWRDSAGQAHVWEDRCPHRGMRLSFGFVRGDHIACLYHGWQYDAAGQCRHIPAHPALEVPQTIRVPRFGLREAAGLIWISAGDDMQFPLAWEAIVADPVQSLAVEAPLGDLVAALSGEGWAGDGRIGTLDCTQSGRLILGLHPAGARKTILHVLLQDDAARGDRTGRQRAAAGFAQALRDRIETAAVGSAVA